MNIKTQQGMSLVELMISMVIGLVLLGGVLTIYVNSRQSYHIAQSNNTLLSDIRFATHLIRQDVRLAGSYGIMSPTLSVTNNLANIAGDCAPGWFSNTDFIIFGSNDTNPYAATCIGSSADYKANTDILVIRYADPDTVATADLVADTVYVRTTPTEGELFIGTAEPVLSSETATVTGQNNKLQAVAYYISNFTDAAGDGYPSLHRIRLGVGPALLDEVVVPGVEDMQIQFGYDDDGDGSVDQYVNADNPVLDWTDSATTLNIKSVAISMLLVAEESENGLDTGQTFNYADKSVTVANDGKLRKLVTTVLPLVNQLN